MVWYFSPRYTSVGLEVIKPTDNQQLLHSIGCHKSLSAVRILWNDLFCYLS